MHMYRLFILISVIGALSIPTFSQTGPAGVGNTSSNILWLDAQNPSSLSGSLVNDDPIATWSDVSGNGNDFVQQGADPVPVFRNDGLSSGSYNVVRFDGTERYLVHPDDDDFDLNLSEFTILAVYYKGSSDDDPRGILSKRTSYGSQESYYLYTYTGNTLRLNTRTSGNSGVVSANALSVGDNLIAATFTGALQQLHIDSDQEASGSKTGTINNSTSSIFIGALNNNYGTYFDGEIAELIMYRTALNGGERLVVENYLAEKYGLTITNDFFGNDTDYSSSYDADIRGIGTGDGSNLHDVSGFSSGLQLEAVSGLDNSNEFVLFAHNSAVSHSDASTANIASADIVSGDITNRWAKDYYFEVSQGGSIDAATVDTKFVFDFSEAGLAFSGSSSDYVLLYRENTSDDFSRVFAYEYALENSDQIVVSIPASRLKTGYYTLGRGTQITTRKWYVLQNGNWSDASTWTLDAGSAPIPNNPSNETPGVEDDVIIRTGKTVTMTTDNIAIGSITVDGTLIVSTTTGHDFNQIDGQGTIRISGNGGVSNFPEGNTVSSNGFGNPINGGLLSVRGTGLEFNEDETFKDVRILLDNPTDIVQLGANLTINGDFNVRYGTLQFGDGSGVNRTFTVLGDFKVENNGGSQDGRVSTAFVASSNTRHEFNLYGNFLNEGTAQFSDRTAINYTSESANGVVDLNLINTTDDQRVDCNGLTYFYRIEIVKGSTDFTAFIQADDPGNFILTGYANDDTNSDITIPSQNENALGLVTGTVSLGTNVNVRLNTTGNYSIGSSAKLVVNGAMVTKTGGAAITPYGTIEVIGGILEVPSGSGITTRDAGQINVSGGQVWVSQIRTSIQGVNAQGGFQQTGGTVNVWDYSAAESPILGTAAGSANNDYARFSLVYEGNAFTMTGGTLNVKDATSSGLLFINSNPDNIKVQGGTVNLYSTVSGNSEIASKAPFWNLKILNSSTNTTAKVAAQTLLNGPGGVDDRTITDPDVIVLNDLTIETSTTRTSGSNTYGGYLDLCPGNNCVNLEVGGDLFIRDSGVLDVWAWDGSSNAGSATVTMNGSENAMLYVGDITTYNNSLVEFEYPDTGPWPSGFGSGDETYGIYTLPFYNWVIDKEDAVLFLSAKNPSKGNGSPGSNASLYKTSNGGKNLSRYAVRLVVVTNEFELLNGTLNQNDPVNTLQLTEGDGNDFGNVGDPVGYGMYLLGSVTNNGNCFVYDDGVTRKEGTVNIRAENDVTITSADGATFGNLELNNDGYEFILTSDLEVGRLQYAAGIIDIGTHNLKVDVFEFLDLSSSGFIPSVGGQGIYNTSNYIRMAGNASDGGLSIKLPRSLTLYESSTPSFPDANYTEEYNIVDRSSYYDDGQVYNTPDRVWFPIGTAANSTERYTPAVMHIVDDAGVTYSGDEYVTVRLVDKELQTTDLSGGDILSYYWNVSTAGFDGGLPTVSWIFQYDDNDVDAGDETLYVPGKVVSNGSYLRSNDGTAQAVKDGGGTGNAGNIVGTDPANIIMFNGVNIDATVDDANDEIDSGTNDGVYSQGNVDNNWTTPWPGTGFALEAGNYTAGEATRFVGSPEIYYSRRDGDWHQSSTWSTDQTNKHEGASASDYPQVGDVVFIAGNSSDGSHTIIISEESSHPDDIEVEEVTFNGGGSPSLVMQTNGDLNSVDLGIVKGEAGTTSQIIREIETSTYTFTADIGDWASFSENQFQYKKHSPSGTLTIPTDLSEFPTLAFAGNRSGDKSDPPSYDLILGHSITVNGDMIFMSTVDFELEGGATETITVAGDVNIGANNDARVTFPETGFWTLDIAGDLGLLVGTSSGWGEQAELLIDDNATVEHLIKLGGDLVVEEREDGVDGADPLIDLVANIGGGGIILEFTGENDGTTNITNSGGSVLVPDLYKIVMNKGSDLSNTFTIASEINLPQPTDLGAAPVEILNGLLIFDDPSLDITLADGTQGDFYLPNTLNTYASSGSGGLEIKQGTANISGDDTGIILDGLLRVSGGTLDMAITGDNGNNFIEYGSSDNASIEVTDGSLLVGSQLRRKLTAVTGLLNYTQTAGIARFGIEAAPENTRGVFELTNSGSEFTHTGGEFTIVRQNGSSTVGSFILKPDTDDLDVSGSTITFGNSDTPVSQSQIGIDSNVPLNKILVTGNNSPTVVIFNTSLELDSLTIETGGTFDANGFALTINEDLVNDGVFQNGGTDINQQTTYFASGVDQSISGSGITNFYNLTKDGSSTLDIQKNITVDNDLEFLDGTMSTDTYAVNLKGDMTLDGTHQSSSVGPGIVFNGTGGQNLDTSTDTGEFGVMTLDNSNGLEIPGDGRVFAVNDKIVITSGVFNIGGNLLVMNESAYFENGLGATDRAGFNKNSMISVNASITDNGVRKVFNDSYTGTYLYPVGLNYYTPAEINITGMSGGDTGQITVKPIEDIAGGISDDSDETCFGDNSDYDDTENILQFYWLIRSANITDFDGSIYLYHVDALESVNNTQGLGLTNYAPARLLNNSSAWDKAYSEALFDETNNVIMFKNSVSADYADFTSTDITGTYTAGITRDNSDGILCGGAIPDIVPEYITIGTSGSGSITDISSFATADGGTVPSLGESPDLTVAGDFTLDLTSQFWRFRKVTIEPGATLTITGAGVNLGTIEGEGTLKLYNTNALPAGDYASFEANSGCTQGGILELEVTSGNSVDLALPFNNLRGLVVSGDGEKVITNGTSFDICEDLEILDAGTLTMGDNTTLRIKGDIIKETATTFDGDNNNARIILNGSTQQTIDGAFEGSEMISYLRVNNAAGVTVLNATNDNVEVEDLVLTNGKIVTDADNSLIVINTGTITGNFSSTTFVNGPLKRRLETSTDRQLFPVGSGSVYQPFEVSNTLGYTGTKDWSVQYHDEDPGTTALITNVNDSYDFSTWGGEENDLNSTLFREDVFEVEVASPATADVRPYWDSDSDVGATWNEWQYLRVMVWDSVDESWGSYGNGNLNYSGMTASRGSIVSDTDLSFSTNFVTLGSNEPVPLPVEFVFFTARLADNGTVVLDWQTASEISNDRFEVERINADGEFEVIGTVKGAGDSNELLDYQFKDYSPYHGINYYRLRQVDYDGQYEYSGLVMVNNDDYFKGLDVTVYPNPVEGDQIGLIIKSGDELSDIQLVLMDVAGRTLDRVVKTPIIGSAKYEMDFRKGEVGSGLFYLIVVQGENKKVMRVLVK